MPKKLTSDVNAAHAFWYKQNVAPPKDWDKWEQLVEAFTRHLVERYGEEEVAQWYFEVWNEPNIDFWVGDPKEATYFELYDHAVRAVKRVSPRLRVGGPATAQAAWADRFLAHCKEKNVPVDFVSTHVYGNDKAEDVFGTHEQISRNHMVCRAVKKVHEQIAASAYPQIPLIWSEYNAAYDNHTEVTDSAYMGPYLADTIRQCDGLTSMMSYWTFSDVFEEQGVVKTPFYGGFGLLAEDNIPKAAFNDFALLHRWAIRGWMSNRKTRWSHGEKMEHWLWRSGICFCRKKRGRRRRFKVHFSGRVPKTVRTTIVDQEHGSPLPAYQKMGSPRFPSREQIVALRKAAALPASKNEAIKGGELNITLQPHALAIIEIAK